MLRKRNFMNQVSNRMDQVGLQASPMSIFLRALGLRNANLLLQEKDWIESYPYTLFFVVMSLSFFSSFDSKHLKYRWSQNDDPVISFNAIIYRRTKILLNKDP